MGPALNDVGGRAGAPAYLRLHWMDPAGNVPELFRVVDLQKAIMARRSPECGFTEDTWSIQVLDFKDGRLHSPLEGQSCRFEGGSAEHRCRLPGTS